MSSFLDFITEDIQTKKSLFSAMPVKTKRDIKKFNEKIDVVSGKYEEYKTLVKKYLDTKSKSFNVKKSDTNIDDLTQKVASLEHVRFILNPLNTSFEKMGFDNLIYEISNYSDFNFKSLNSIINQFLDKFELAGIKLNASDFDYTCYVNEYMTAFLEIRNSKSEDYNKISEIFEKIYWVNPEIIGHIELNFRKLIRKHERSFNNYIVKIQNETMSSNKISNYDDCLDKLRKAYSELKIAEQENIAFIIELAKNGSIEMNNYFENSKVRNSTYTSLMLDDELISDNLFMDKFYANLGKLKLNIEEYRNYVKFIPLIDDFKAEYEKQIVGVDKTNSKTTASKTSKDIELQILEKESKLEKMNKKIFGGSNGFFDFKGSGDSKQLKLDSVIQAKELYNLYQVYDKEYFKDKILSVLSNYLTVADLLNLYYSFDYFKKMAIKRVFNIVNHEEVIKYSEDFDLFAMNTTNVVVNGIVLFENVNVAKVIVNKYRLDNINITEESLNPDNLDSLLEKIQFLLRINEIEKSSSSIEKLWFIAQVEKFNRNEKKKTA